MLRVLICYVLCFLANAIFATELPPYIRPCSIGDPVKMNECFVRNGNKAIPDLVKGDKNFKIPVLDPLKIDHVKFSPGSQLTIDVKKVEVFGLKHAQLLAGRFEEGEGESGKLIFQIFIPNVTITGDYEAKGQILILPLDGKGRMNMQMIKMAFNYTFEFDNMRFESTKNLKLKSTDIKFMPEQIVYKFDNLFNGNKLLSDATNNILTENWKAVHEDLGPVFGATVDKIFKSIVIGVLEKFNFKQGFLP